MRLKNRAFVWSQLVLFVLGMGFLLYQHPVWAMPAVAPLSFNFVSSNPAHLSLNVLPSQPITLSFSMPISATTVTTQTVGVSGTHGGHSWSYSVNGSTLTIIPNAPWYTGETIYLSLSAGLKSSANDPLSPTQIQFTVAATALPACQKSLVAINPAMTAVSVGSADWGDYDDIPLTVTAPGVLANDTDADGDILTAAVYYVPLYATVNLNSSGAFVYTPNANFYGVDTFDYYITDTPVLGSEAGERLPTYITATVTITVTAVNGPRCDHPR